MKIRRELTKQSNYTYHDDTWRSWTKRACPASTTSSVVEVEVTNQLTLKIFYEHFIGASIHFTAKGLGHMTQFNTLSSWEHLSLCYCQRHKYWFNILCIIATQSNYVFPWRGYSNHGNINMRVPLVWNKINEENMKRFHGLITIRQQIQNWVANVLVDVNTVKTLNVIITTLWRLTAA